MHNPSPMRVTDGQPRPWLADNYPCDSAARDQNHKHGTIYKRPSGLPDSDSSALYCAVSTEGYYCARSQSQALQGVGGQVYDQLPPGAIVVSRRSDAEA